MAQNFTSMDHADVMDSLVLFMRSQEEFKDFNFDGSAIKELLRILAYNSQQQAFQNNFIYNELQLDSAQLRPNLTSLASRLGYTPSSKRAASIRVNIVVTPIDAGTADASIVMNRDTSFYATNDGAAYTFSPDRDYSASLVNGVYTFNDVKLLQGVWALNAFQVQVKDGVESYILPSSEVDTTTLEIYVRSSETSGDQQAYTAFKTAYDLGEDSKIYFLRENRNGFFEFKFGDGKFSTKLNYGNVITARYLVTQGEVGNNLSNIVPASSISGLFNVQLSKIDSKSYGGTEEEGLESIRTLAPLSFVASDNAVTASDYVAITKKVFPETKEVISWGGEVNDPPRYGYTFIAVKPKNSEVLTDNQKIDLIDALKKYNVGSITPVIADPVYTYLNVVSNIKYDPRLALTTPASLKAKIVDACNKYSDDKLEKFNGRMEMSKFSEFINGIDKSVVGNFTRISYEKRFVPIVNYTSSYSIKFYHAIEPGTVLIENFRMSDAASTGASYYIVDEAGVLVLKKVVGAVTSVFVANIGTVDYSTGAISLINFRPNSVLGDYMTAKANPADAYDIDSSITGFNNIVLAINDVSINLTTGIA